MMITLSFSLSGLLISLRTGNRWVILGLLLTSVSGLLLPSVTNFLDTKSPVEMARILDLTLHSLRTYIAHIQALSSYRVDLLIFFSQTLFSLCPYCKAFAYYFLFVRFRLILFSKIGAMFSEL